MDHRVATHKGERRRVEAMGNMIAPIDFSGSGALECNHVPVHPLVLLLDCGGALFLICPVPEAHGSGSGFCGLLFMWVAVHSCSACLPLPHAHLPSPLV